MILSQHFKKYLKENWGGLLRRQLVSILLSLAIIWQFYLIKITAVLLQRHPV